jgi:2-methylcitrate dehydratase PrpD
MTHSAIDAALAARPAVGAAEAIERIEVHASSMVTEMVGKPFRIGRNPQVDAQFSIPYTVACALVRGDVFLEDFEPEAIAEKAVLDLAAKVQVIEDKALAAKDILPARLCVHKSGAAPVETRIEAPLGNPLRPMTDDLCRRKFEKCLDYSGYAIDAGTRDDLLASIATLETMSDVRSLLVPVTR